MNISLSNVGGLNCSSILLILESSVVWVVLPRVVLQYLCT